MPVKLLGRFCLLGYALASVCAPLAAQPTDSTFSVFVDPKGRYTFSYPSYFRLDHLFADGSGELHGIRAEPGDAQEASIAVYIEKPHLNLASLDAYTEQVKQGLTLMPGSKVVALGKRKMLDQDASDVQVDRGKMRTRHIGLILKDQEVVVRCVYTQAVAQMFAPACELVADTLKMKR